MAKKKKFKNVQIDVDRVVWLEGVARRERVANEGSRYPTWGDILRRLIDNARKAL